MLPAHSSNNRGIGQLLVLAHFKINAIRVSKQQFPVLDEAAENFAQRLGIEIGRAHV